MNEKNTHIDFFILCRHINDIFIQLGLFYGYILQINLVKIIKTIDEIVNY